MLKYRTFESKFYCNAEGDTGGDGGGAGGQNADAKGGTGGQQQQDGTGGTGGVPKLAWLPNATTEEIAFAQSKGWDKNDLPPVDQVFKSYHNLQKVFGADKAGNTVVVPGETADESTLNNFYNKLGRPEKLDGYTAKEFAGLDAVQETSLKELAHKNGFTDKQLTALKEWNDNTSTQIQTTLETNVKVEFAKQEAALKNEWGAKYDDNLAAAKIATAKLGLTEAQVNAMQVALGYDGVMKLVANVGTGLGEGSFHTGDKGRAGGEQSNILTPEQAKGELNKLGNDKTFMDAWKDKMHPRHQEMIEKKSQLTRWANGQR